MASFTSELIARIKLRLTGTQELVAQAGTVGDAVGKGLSKKLGLKAALSGFFAGLGLGVHKISETIAEAIVGGTEQGFKEAEQLFAQESKLIQQRILAGLDEAAQRKFFEKQRDRAALAEKSASGQMTRKEIAAAQIQQGLLFRGIGTFFGLGDEALTDEERLKKIGEARLEQREAELALAQLDKQAREDKARDEKEIARVAADVAERRLANEREVMPLEQQVALLADDIARAKQAAVALDDKSLAGQKARLDVEQKIHALNQLNERLANEKAEAAAKAAREAEKEKDHREKIARLEERVADAAEKVRRARRDYADQFRDRIAFGLDEAASGRRGNATDRAQARSIQRLEQRARRLFDLGGSDFRDERGRRVGSEAFATRLLTEADRLRSGFGRLNSSDRDPLRDAAEAIKDSEKHLAEIRKELASERIK